MNQQGGGRRSLGGRILDLWLIWLKGQFLLSCIMGGAAWALGDILGLAYAGILGVLAGVMESVPVVGPALAIVPAAIVALWRGSSVIPVPNWAFALIIIAAYLVLQQIGNWIVQPRLMGRRLKLPSLLVLAAVLVGTLLCGIVGTILAVPLLATVWELVATLQGSRRASIDSDPPPPTT